MGLRGHPPNHKWPDSQVRAYIWVVCPHAFREGLTRGPQRYDKLANWARGWYKDGAVVWHQILWVLSPDPGCEL